MQPGDPRTWFWLVVTVGLGWLTWRLAPVFTPFLISAMLAYLGDPLVDRLEKWRLPRGLAVTMVFVVIFLVLVAILLLLVPKLEQQLGYLVSRLPDYLRWLRDEAMPWLEKRLGLEPMALRGDVLVAQLTENWQQAGGVAARLVGSLSTSGITLMGWLANFVLIPVVTFYLLRDWDVLVENIHALIPRTVEEQVARLARESDEVLGAFLRGQFLVMSALALIYSTGLMIAGLKLGLLIGLLAGMVSFVPYLGFIVGIGVAGVAAVVQTHDASLLPWVVVAFGVGQMLEGMVLTPWLVGDRVGLHPVAVIFAVLAGGQLFGFFGVLLALPVASVVADQHRHAHQRYLASDLYGAP